nr:hypothetical protein [Salinicola acroporae]
MGRRVPGLHFPLAVAAAYSGRSSVAPRPRSRC